VARIRASVDNLKSFIVELVTRPLSITVLGTCTRVGDPISGWPPCTAEGGLRAVEDVPDDIKRGDDPKHFRRDFPLSAEDRVRKVGASFIQGARSEAWNGRPHVSRAFTIDTSRVYSEIVSWPSLVVIAYSSQSRESASK
jgi:hypothetical protein